MVVIETMPFVASMSAPNGICWPPGSGTPFTSTVPEIGTTLKFTPATGSGSAGAAGVGADGVGVGGGVVVGGKPGGVGTVHARWSTTFETGFVAPTVSGARVVVPQLAFVALTR